MPVKARCFSRFKAGVEARVELSDAADGRVYADAIRWRYVDPDNPNALRYDGVAPWDSGGRGGISR